MKSKLYYYEMVIEKEFNDKSDISTFLKDLRESTVYRVVGYDIKKKPKSKKIGVKMQLLSFKDELSFDDVRILTVKLKAHPSSFRTRSITGDDLAIFRSLMVVASVSEKALMDTIFVSVPENKEENADDTKSN